MPGLPEVLMAQWPSGQAQMLHVGPRCRPPPLHRLADGAFSFPHEAFFLPGWEEPVHKRLKARLAKHREHVGSDIADEHLGLLGLGGTRVF